MSLRIATVGHVDHGKSTLIGRLLADTGQTRDDRQAKVRSFCESEGRKFEFAFLLDALEEEQAQGITIDVTEVPWNYAGQPFTFVDTPGHREFLKKMVGGASKVDAAILLVDVVEGIRDSLRRQLRVLDLLGVRNLILLVNKMDLVNWSEAAWLEREKEIRALLRGSKARIHVLPAAAWHGANLLERSAQMPWYEGPTLVEAMLEVAASAAKPLGPARFRVQDVYRFEDKRILVGRMESGELRAGDRLAFYPSGQESIVRSIEVYGEERSLARAGEAIGITLADPLYLDRGALGFAPSAPPALAHGAIADLFWLSPSALEAGASLVIKCGTQRAEAKVARVLEEIDADTFEESSQTRSVRLFGRVELSFAQPVALDRFEECEPTGRFVACLEGQVCGGGRWVEARGQEKRALKGLHSGRVLWLTGLSGAGKSTLAAAVKSELERAGQSVMVLDGDELRKGLCRDLGFSAEDRRENLRRAAEVAKLFAESGFVVITAFISPLTEHREMARAIIGGERFREIFVDAPLPVCERRDVKGLYRKARLGQIPEFTGVSAPFETPVSPDLRVPTADGGVEQSALMIFEFLQNTAFEDARA